MSTSDAEFLQKLLAMFTVEAKEHLQVITNGLAKMQDGDVGSRAELVEGMYREAHSLKGAARSVNLADIVALCRSMENVFSLLKNERLTFTPDLGDLLLQAGDTCLGLVDGKTPSATEQAAITKFIRRLDAHIAAHTAPAGPGHPAAGKQAPAAPALMATPSPAAAEPPPPTIAPFPPEDETIRISTAALDALLLQAEEMISVKIASGQRVAELRALKKQFDVWDKWQRKERPGQSDHPDRDSFFSGFGARLSTLLYTAEEDHRESGLLIDALLEDMKKTVMLPFASMLSLFPPLVRDLARTGGKKVELTTTGGEIRIDRRVLEELKAPLLHLLRNCLDHGMEPPDERVKKKKPAYGAIKIGAASCDSRIEITVADDGRGIDPRKIRAAAVKAAVLSHKEADALPDRDALPLIFHSGLTTSPLITDISGRGLGLAIVKEKVEKLNGTLTVETEMNAGTTIRMIVPLTLATFKGVVVRVADRLFLLPSTHVERVTRAKKETIRTVENRETLLVDGMPVAFVRLGDLLALKVKAERHPDGAPVQVVVLGSAERRMAFMVDEILREQEVLVKPLGRQLSRVRNILGAAILGNGKVVPILNVPDLLKSAVKTAPAGISGPIATADSTGSILVVEDSITARMLMKNILESAGYDVATAVDGLDAIAVLRQGSFDLVVSDVEMPRMNGFELTAKIRADKRFAELPVVLVTALESREDRERGIDVGANAYIVKSSFDQSNLLDVIGRLT